MTATRRLLASRPEALTLLAILIAVQLLPRGVPFGVYLRGVFDGALLGLQATGLILAYRGNRIINFSQVQIGAIAAVVFVLLVKFQSFLRMGHWVCGSCVPQQADRGWALVANYLLSALAAIALAVIASSLVYSLVIEPLTFAPRLVASVATLFVAEVIAGAQAALPAPKLGKIPLRVLLRPVSPPGDFHFTVGPERFHLADLLSVGILALAGLALGYLLLRTRIGLQWRVAADNPLRAEMLGVDAPRVAGKLWLVIGALSGAAGLMSAMGSSGSAAGATSDPFALSLLVVVLASCVLARFASLGYAVAAAGVFGILQAAIVWANGSRAVLAGVLFAVILLGLLIQNRPQTRADVIAASSWRAVREVRSTPRQLRAVPVVRFWRRAGAGTAIVALLGAPWVLTVGEVNLTTVVFITGVIGASLLILSGWCGQINLGQLALAGVGGFVVGATRLPFLLALAGAGACGALAAVAAGLPALRLRGLQLAVTTLALAYAVAAILLDPSALGRYLRPVIARPDLLGLSLEDGRSFYYFCLVFLALVLVGLTGIRYSRIGRGLLAMRDNDTAAQLFSLGYVRSQLGAFGMSGFVAGLGGALYAYSQHAVNVTSFSPSGSVLLFLSVVLGGLGSIGSPMIGVLVFGLLQIFGVATATQELVVGVVGLVFISFAPGGVGMMLYDIRDALLRRVARRYRISVPSLLSDDEWRHRVAPIVPPTNPGGGSVYVPAVYRLADQWLVEAAPTAATGGGYG